MGLVNFHLYSYSLITKLAVSSSSLSERIQIINRAVHHAYKEQEKEVDIILKKAGSVGIPVILAGDLNNIPDSYCYHQFTNSFNDSFMKKGRGRGVTYPLFGIGVRIDYQFSSKNIQVLEHTILKSNFSDHYALSVRYRL